MRGNSINRKCQHGRIRAMADNENNRSLTPTGNKSFPTVCVGPGAGAKVGGGAEMPAGLTSMTSMKKAVPTAAKEQLRGDPNLSGGLKMPRTKDGR
jgi:hypothetical protein